MSTDARLQEHHVSKALLPGPRRTPKFPTRPIPHAPTRACDDATLPSHARNGDRTRHPGGRLTGLDSLPCGQCEGAKADRTPEIAGWRERALRVRGPLAGERRLRLAHHRRAARIGPEARIRNAERLRALCDLARYGGPAGRTRTCANCSEQKQYRPCPAGAGTLRPDERGNHSAAPIPEADRISKVCRPIMRSSSVGTTHAETRDRSALMRPAPASLRAASGSRPSQVQPSITAARVAGSFSPIPAVKISASSPPSAAAMEPISRTMR